MEPADRPFGGKVTVMEKTKKKRIKISKWKTFSIGSILMLGTTICGFSHLRERMAEFQPEKFPNDAIELSGYRISHKIFYKNLVEENGSWFYRDQHGQLIDLQKTTDFRIKDDLSHNSFVNVQCLTKIDSVEIKRDRRTKEYIYSLGNRDSLRNLPSMGLQDYGRITIRHFWSKDPLLAQKFRIYNDEYNCTWRHEYQHFLNAKAGIMKSGHSYETKFSHACMDEVSANIAQLLEQRKNYVKTGDLNRITDRFKFYRHWVLMQPQPLSSEIGEAEKKMIATGIFDTWKKDKFEVYEKNNFEIAKFRLSRADYNGCTDHPQDHRQIMHDVFHINGIDFYKYINGREKEFVDMLSTEHKEEFARLTNAKKAKMKYMEKVGQYTNNDENAKKQYFKALKEKQLWQESYINKLISR